MKISACCAARGAGKTAGDWFLQNKGSKLTANEQAFLRAQQQSWFGLWEVQKLEPGQHIELEDLLSGERRRVIDQKGSQS